MPDAVAETTPQKQTGSLESASTAIAGLLSVKPEDKPSSVKPPEQVPPKEKPAEPKQVPAEPTAEEDTPTAEEIEQATSDDDGETPDVVTPQPKVFKVKDNGQEIEVTEEEAIKSYLRIQDYTRKTQALADERRQFEDGIVRAARERDAQYATQLEQLSAAITATIPVEPDWEKLKGELTPEALSSRLLDWQQRQKHLESIRAEQAKIAERQAEDAAHGFRQHVQQEQAKLEDKLPDMKDPEKANALKTDLSEFAKSAYGFTDADLKQVTDHRLVLLLRDAREHQKAQAKAPKIANKIEKAMETSAPGARTSVPKANKLTEATKRLKQSGSVDDGAAAIAAYLEKVG